MSSDVNIFGYSDYLKENSVSAYKHRVNNAISRINSDNIQELIIKNNNEDLKVKHESIRFVFLKESLNYILKRPIFGYGTGSFGAIFKREVKSGYNYDIKTTPHNNYLYVYLN